MKIEDNLLTNDARYNYLKVKDIVISFHHEEVNISLQIIVVPEKTSVLQVWDEFMMILNEVQILQDKQQPQIKVTY